jgi:hypothetical protein
VSRCTRSSPEVTERIIERSKPSRRRYLELIAEQKGARDQTGRG